MKMKKDIPKKKNIHPLNESFIYIFLVLPVFPWKLELSHKSFSTGRKLRNRNLMESLLCYFGNDGW